MECLIIFLTVVVGGLLMYLYGTRNFDYFKKLGIPSVKPTVIFGNMTGTLFRTKPFVEILNDAYKLHPDAKYVGFYDLTSPVIVLKDPELVKSVTIKNFDSFPDHKLFTEGVSEPVFEKSLFALKGEKWRKIRSVLSPAFTSSKMKVMFKIVSQCAADFGNYLANENPRSQALDMRDALKRYTLDVIASSAFGISVNSMKDRDNEFYRIGKSFRDLSGLRMVKFLVMKSCPWLANLLKLKFFDGKACDYLENVIKNTIATRDAKGIVRPDMIQVMMQARYTEKEPAPTPEDITAQGVIFLLGGVDSPATTMSFAVQALAINPDIQQKLQAEIDEVMERSPGEVSYEDLHAMKYLDAVVNETLRMFPPAPVLDRVGPKSFTLPPALPGLEPLHIKAGQSIWIPCYSVHHDPQYFPDPDKFDPERFNEENKSKVPPFTYFPFGLGPRICIAHRFALMQVKLVLFHVLAKCNILPSSKTQTPIKLSAKSLNMVPEGGFWLKIEPRY